MPDELKALAGILGPTAAILGGAAAVGGLLMLFNADMGSLSGSANFPQHPIL